MHTTPLAYRTPVIALAISGLLLAATALAAPITNPHALVQSAVGSEGQVSLWVDDEGVATLSGYTHSASVAHKAEMAALKGEGVRRVVNLINGN